MISNIEKYLTASSREKQRIINLPNGTVPLTQLESNLINQMCEAYTVPIYLEKLPPMSLSNLVNIFTEFYRTLNTDNTDVPGTKFITDIRSMSDVLSVVVITNLGRITCHFLSYSLAADARLIAALLHAIHTFCHMFSYDYDGLVMHICLDHNQRRILTTETDNLTEIFQEHKMRSAAFNTSGVTMRYQKIVNLTRCEEIIKLCFHELVHVVGLDAALVHMLDGDFGLDVANHNLIFPKPIPNFFR